MSVKEFSSSDTGIKLVKKPNDIDEYEDDPDVLRAELSCGHVTDAMTLTNCCKAQLDEGQSEFRCLLCKKEWPYDEVRKTAKLSIEEQNHFEELLGTNTVKKFFKLRICPGCGNLIERVETSNLCVQCLYCTKATGKIFEFCWKCVREWKGPRPRADQCGNVGCNSPLDILRDCTMINIFSVECPSVRACPFCGAVIEHNAGCKFVTCYECKKNFCFVCLKPATECTPDHFAGCTAGVAPRQTDIP